MISVDDFVLLCGRTLDGYERAIGGLEDSWVNELPDLPDPNSPYQLVTHALGAGWWWTAHIVCGHPVERDRDGEFTAVGSRGELQDLIARFRLDLGRLAPELGDARELANPAQTQYPLGAPWTVGSALLHAYEELAQHLGHLEITVDLIRQRCRG